MGRILNPSGFSAEAMDFPGFGREAISILDRLKAEPHIDAYRREKEAIDREITGPFRRYRDDLVAHWVMADQLDLETTRNVFSRLLKNDFGAGGCHHHVWLSFYRRGRTRLRDVQLGHSLSPDGLTVSVFVGGYEKELLAALIDRIGSQFAEWKSIVAPLVRDGFEIRHRTGVGSNGKISCHSDVDDFRMAGWERANSLWISRTIPAEEVVRSGPALMPGIIQVVRDLRPVYEFYMGTTVPTSA